MEPDRIKKVYESLLKIEAEIDVYVQENSFYLNFGNKAWASTPAGQYLLLLSEKYLIAYDEIYSMRGKEGDDGYQNSCHSG